MQVKNITTEEANSEIARLLHALRPYSMDELEELSEMGMLRISQQRAYDEINTLTWLLGEEDR